MNLLSTDEAETAAVSDALNEWLPKLYALADKAPALLRRLPPGRLSARLALREAAVESDRLGEFLTTIATQESKGLFPSVQVLLFDKDHDEAGAAGSMGFRVEGQRFGWRHLTEGGSRGIDDALKLAEDFAERNNLDVEARLLAVPDLRLRALLLVPRQPRPRAPVYVVPYSPPPSLEDRGPLTREAFLARVSAWRRQAAAAEPR
jgi:hypothetical protein